MLTDAAKDPLVDIIQAKNHSTFVANCSLSLASDMEWNLKKDRKGKEIIIFSLFLNGDTGPLLGPFPGTLYRPLEWILILGKAGKRFLLMDENFIQKSVYTLGFSVLHFPLSVIQSPENCFENASLEYIETAIQNFILYKLAVTIDVHGNDFEVCNSHYLDNGSGKGAIHFICCKRTRNGKNCELYDHDLYITALKLIVTVVTMVLSTFFPFLIRNSYFQKLVSTVYRFVIREGDNQKVMIKRDKQAVVYINSFPIQREFENFRRDTATLKPGVTYCGLVNSIYVLVEGKRILRDNVEGPVSFFSFISDFFPGGGLKKKCRWLNDFLKKRPNMAFVYNAFLTLIEFTVLMSPLVCVFVFYNRNLKVSLKYEQKAAESRHLVSSSRVLCDVVAISVWVIGSLSMVLYILVIFIPAKDLQQANTVILACLEKAKKSLMTNKIDILLKITNWWKKNLGLHHGWRNIKTSVCFLLLLPMLVLFYVAVLLCVFHPLLNLICRLIYAFVKADRSVRRSSGKESHESKLSFLCKVYGFCWTFGVLVYSWAFCFLCVPFYLTCIIYTLLGFLLNYQQVLNYFTVLSLTIFVAYDGANHVSSWYRRYFKLVCEKLYETLDDQMQKITKDILLTYDKSKPVRNRSAEYEIIIVPNKLNAEDRSDFLDFKECKDGNIRILFPRALLFIENNGRTCYTSISNKLFEKMVTLPHVLCPGEIHVFYLKKLAHFIVTTLTVLSLVFIVLFMVEKSEDYDEGVQTMAAIGSGVFLFALRKFIFMERSVRFDDGNKEMLSHMIHYRFQNCCEAWTVVDINVSGIAVQQG